MKKLLRISSLILVFALLFSLSVLATGEPEDPGICAVVVNDPNVTFVALDANGAAVAAVEDPDIGTYYPNAVQFRVTLANQSNGAFRFLRVQDVAGVFQEQNLVYIDQVTVAGGNAVYEHVYPSELKKGVTYHVYVTGNDGYEETEIMTFGYHQSYMPGNVDGDEGITATDALWVLQIVAGTREFDGTQSLAANVDGDEGVTATDALWILQNVAGTREF